jgi:nicotinate phosphoribosyltransferase
VTVRTPPGDTVPGVTPPGAIAMAGALTTDLYELTMAASYLHRGMTEPATFSLFARRLPAHRGFLVAAGLADALSYLERLSFRDEDLAWLTGHGFSSETAAQLSTLRFTGDVLAVPEGRVLLPDEPFLEVTAPLPEAQLVETVLVNQITYQTAVATKAARCRLAAGGIELVDFALRRTHGIEAGLSVARASAIAGFVATSNVDAARRFGLRTSGTMAHSYVEAFAREEDAFVAFAEDRPGPVTFLVDTYDTMSGVDAAIRVMRRLGLTEDLAIRLDSGNLESLARLARRRLDAAGFPQVRIFVSGGLDEYDLERLRNAHAPIDAAGIGTHMGVSSDAPSLDSAYKLVAYAGRPVCKLSEGKATLPGPKQVYRRGFRQPDVLATRDEPPPEGAEALLVPVIQHGRRTDVDLSIDAARLRLEGDLQALPADALDLHDPKPRRPALSVHLARLAETLGAARTGSAHRIVDSSG